MKRVLTLAGAALLTLGVAVDAQAQAQTQNPLTAGAKRTYDIIKGYITRAAEKMPEDQYAFKASPDVRSFGQLVGHIADGNYLFCGGAAGDKPAGGIEKSKTTKADLQKALAESFAYCDKVHASMTDAAGAATVNLFGNEMAKLSVLEFNTHHDFEHYGNMVTYMRIKGIVPPSSEK